MTSHTIMMFEESHVKDFDRWKSIFDENRPLRKEHGFLREMVFQDVENPNHISLIFEVTSEQEAIGWMRSDVLQEAFMQAGVIGEPKIVFFAM